MNQEILFLAGTAASIGFLHTILGPDHYLPFIAMSKARGWTLGKTMIITVLCGLGHVIGSIVLGLAGVYLGVMVFSLETIESFRGDLAAWLLIGFGLVYFLWGIRHAIRCRQHEHQHSHESGDSHSHVHCHLHGHSHLHAATNSNVTPWVLFTIFVLGPCEPLIPLIMYPAAKFNLPALLAVSIVFSVVTIATMAVSVMVVYCGLSGLSFSSRFENKAHAMAGLTILLCGMAIKFMGL